MHGLNVSELCPHYGSAPSPVPFLGHAGDLESQRARQQPVGETLIVLAVVEEVPVEKCNERKKTFGARTNLS